MPTGPTVLTNAFVPEVSVATANAGIDFSTQSTIPAAFLITGGGTLTFTDRNGDSYTVHATQGVPYPYAVKSISACTGSGYVQFFPSLSALPISPPPIPGTLPVGELYVSTFEDFATATTPSTPDAGHFRLWYDGTALQSIDASAVIAEMPRSIYGEMYVNAGVASQTLTTAGTYYKITQWTNAGITNYVTVDPTTNDNITIQVAGNYKVDASLSFTGANSTTYTFAIYVDGTPDAGSAAQAKLNSNGDAKSVSVTGLFVFAAGAVVDVRVTADGNTKTFAVTYGNINVHQV